VSLCWFNVDSKAAVQQVGDSDIAALTGLVKLYFRELPDGLLTNEVYRDMDKAMGSYILDARLQYFLFISSFPFPLPSHSPGA